MIIDFESLKENVNPNFKGGEKEFKNYMYMDDKNKIMKGKLEPGASIGFHMHDDGSEIIYILKGCGKVIYDAEKMEVKEGQCHYCPKGHGHSLINDSSEDLEFFAVVCSQ